MRCAVVFRLRHADYVLWCFKAGAAGSQRRDDAQRAAGSFALGNRVCLCDAAGSLTYLCTGGRLRNLHTIGICLCVARAAGSSGRSRKAAGSFEKRAAGSFPCSDKGDSLLRQEIAAGSFALCRKGGRLLRLMEKMASHCRSTMQVQGGRLQDPQRV